MKTVQNRFYSRVSAAFRWAHVVHEFFMGGTALGTVGRGSIGGITILEKLNIPLPLQPDKGPVLNDDIDFCNSKRTYLDIPGIKFATYCGQKVNITAFFVFTGPKEAVFVCAAYALMEALKILVVARADYICKKWIYSSRRCQQILPVTFVQICVQYPIYP